MALKRKKKTDRQKLTEKLDKIFSIYIRIKDATPHTGYVRCVTCGAVKHWKDAQCGHYSSRGNMATRWSTTNCHVQCMPCNVMKHGNMIEYRHFMVKKYGEEATEEVERLGHSSKHWSLWELEEMITYYTALVEKVRKEKGL